MKHFFNRERLAALVVIAITLGINFAFHLSHHPEGATEQTVHYAKTFATLITLTGMFWGIGTLFRGRYTSLTEAVLFGCFMTVLKYVGFIRTSGS